MSACVAIRPRASGRLFAAAAVALTSQWRFAAWLTAFAPVLCIAVIASTRPSPSTRASFFGGLSFVSLSLAVAVRVVVSVSSACCPRYDCVVVVIPSGRRPLLIRPVRFTQVALCGVAVVDVVDVKRIATDVFVTCIFRPSPGALRRQQVA